MTNPPSSPALVPQLHDIQGLIIRGYTHPCSVHLLFKFNKAASADAPGSGSISGFFKDLLPYLQNAEDWGALKPEMMLNIGLTAGGIAVVRPDLKVQQSAFSTTFKKGPWDPNNAQQSLGDYGPGAPSKWWNNKFANEDVHCVVHAYAMNPGAQDRIVQIITAAADKSNGTVIELKPLNSATGRLEQYPLIPSDYIHFRYRDSIDEPNLDDNPAGTDQQDLNNFLIGYSTVDDPIPGPISGPEADFAKNGCYNAFRILYQDTQAFYNFLGRQSKLIAPKIKSTEAFAAEWLAAKMCGRWRNGSPLVLSPVKPEPATSKSTKFGYKGDDMQGAKCPFSAHTRVANPRDEGVNVPGATGDPKVDVPRIIRRGMAYGPPLSVDPNADRGLIGLFLCGNLSGQFETLYGWMNMNNFSAVFKGKKTPQDPLIANRVVPLTNNVDPTFTIPMPDGTKMVIKDAAGGLPQFIVTRGTAYFLLPSISSLTGIAKGNV
jgi:deferrochelatase/peroxidase EfeB